MASKLVSFRNYYRNVDNHIFTGQLLIHFIDFHLDKDIENIDPFTISFWEGDSLFFSKDLKVDSFNDVLKEVLSICDKFNIDLEIQY